MDLIRVFLHNTHRLGIIDDEDVMGLRVILAQLRVILAQVSLNFISIHISQTNCLFMHMSIAFSLLKSKNISRPIG